MRDITTGDPGITRAYLEPFEGRAASGEMGDVLKFVATTSGTKRDGLLLDLEGLDTSNYEKNPVFLWVHNYGMPPLGKITKIRKLKQRVEMWVQFDQADDFAVDIERKYREGYLTAVSIGWIITEFERGIEGEDDFRYRVTASDLLDLSAVPVPGDPDALMPRELAAVRSIAANRSPAGPLELPAHGTSSGAPSEPDLCKRHENDDGEVDWNRVAAEMARLLDDGTVTDAEREDRYRHLTRHYRQAGRTAPELLPGIVLADIDVRQLFVEGEWEQYQTEVMMETTEQARAAIVAMRAAADSLEAVLDADQEVEEPVTENRSFVDALGSIRDAIVLPPDEDNEGESDG